MFSLWGILQNADVANKRAHSSKCIILFKKKCSTTLQFKHTVLRFHMKVKKPLRPFKIYEESCDFIHYVDNMHSFF